MKDNMQKRGVIEGMKKLLFGTKEIFMDVVLTDDKTAHIVTAVEGQINIGDIFYLTDESGNQIETTPGDYVTNDGMTITVDETGVILNVAHEEVPEEEMSEDKFMDITLKDGPIVHIATPVEGEIQGKMMIDGVEAAAGEYITNDSRVIVVGESGAIVEVKPVVVAEDAPEVEPEVKEDAPEVNPLAELEAKIASIEAKIGELAETFSALTEKVKKFGAEPSAEPTKTKVDFKKMEREEKLKFFSGK